MADGRWHLVSLTGEEINVIYMYIAPMQGQKGPNYVKMFS